MKVLIVDDSDTEAALLKYLFESEKDMTVVGIAKNGMEAVKLTESLKPDVISMDILMPVMDGFQATSLIMEKTPTPIVVISAGVHDASLNVTFKALEAGALSVIAKPNNTLGKNAEKEFRYLVDTVRAMAEIKVITRRFRNRTHLPVKTLKNLTDRHFEIVAIGSSVGGPQALKIIFSGLRHPFPAPIVVVQHMTPGFIEGFAEWMNDNTPFTVRTAGNQEKLEANTVYFAPDGHHLEIFRDPKNHGLLTKLTKTPPVSGFRPSATVLLESVAVCCGRQAVGMLLTGMGSDGAQGLLALKNAQGHTLIQDRESAVVFGMAGVAQSLGAVDRVVNLTDIADYLSKIFIKSSHPV